MMLFCALTMHHNYLSSFTMIQVYRADRSHHTHLGVTKPYCQLCGSQYIRFNARCKTERKPLPHIFCTARFKQTSVTRYILQIPTTCGMSLFLHHTDTHTHIHLVIKYSLQCPTCPSDFINKLHYFGQCDATWCIKYLWYYWRPWTVSRSPAPFPCSPPKKKAKKLNHTQLVWQV